MTEPAPVESWPYEVLVERLGAGARSLARLAEAYMDTAEEDTSPAERTMLADVCRHVEEATARADPC